jgi:hypothetical protein
MIGLKQITIFRKKIIQKLLGIENKLKLIGEKMLTLDVPTIKLAGIDTSVNSGLITPSLPPS